MARKPHPADDFNARLVANATSWSAFTQAGGRITRHFPTRDDARQAAQVMADGLRRPALVYAIDAQGRTAVADTVRPVFGVCEHDPGQPGTVMISVNGKHLAHAPEIQRSSAVHELAHAIFDMPAVLGTRTHKSYRTTTPPFAKSDTPKPFSWPEWRANAFMGAFLVPEARLGRMLAREAPHLGFDLRWGEAGGVSRPRIRAPRHDERLGILADGLAEVFGVTSLFVAVRLRKCGFIIGEN